MHQALRIDELLREILGYLDRSSLVNLLRTCKAFHDPALDALWALKESLTSLIGLLSPDAVCTESVPSLIGAAALSTATTAIANIVEDDVETIITADISIMAAHEVVRRLSHYVGLDKILLQPWYPSYRGLPDVRSPAINLPEANTNITGNMTLPLPIEILNRELTKEEVACVIHRSAYIKGILYTPGEEKALLVFKAIMKLHPELVFFPELREITIAISPRDSWQWATWLSVPFMLLPMASKVVVREISTRTPLADHGRHNSVCVDLGSILTGVAAYTGTNRLRELVLDSSHLTLVHGRGDSQDGHNGFLHILQAHRSSLRSVSLSVMPGPAVWSALAGLPNMEELRIGHVKYDYVDLTTYPTHPGPTLSVFASLRSLHISYWGISDFTFSCLDMSAFPVLDTVHIVLTDPHHFTSAITYISSRTPNLRRLIVDVDPWNWADPTRYAVLNGADLAPLVHSCDRLEYLKVSSRGSHYRFELDNMAVESMAIAWPSLTFLSLAVDSSPKSAVTLEGLLPFAKHCPNLTTLHLPVDETAVLYVYAADVYRVQLDDPQSTHSSQGENGTGSGTGTGPDQRAPSMLRELDIGAPWVHDIAACAEFLLCVFPNLERLVAPVRYDPASGRMYAWNKVRKLVRGEETPLPVEQRDELQRQLDSMAIDEDYYYEGLDSASSGDDVED